LVAIGNGNSHFAKVFREDYPFIGELYTDTTLESYRFFELPRGFRSTYTLTWNLIMNMLKGRATPGRIQGDALQQGGTFILGIGNKVLFEHVNKYTGDHPNLEEILRVARNS